MGKVQIRYVDSTGTDQVVAALNTSKTDSDLTATPATLADRVIKISQWQGFDKVKVYADSVLVGAVPVDRSEYDTASNGQNEAEVFVEEWDGSSWVKRFRGYPASKPSIDKDGTAILVLKGFGSSVGKQEANVSSVTTDIGDVLSALLPAGYEADVAAASSWPDGVVPSVEGYSLNEQTQIGFREITKNYNASIQFKPETNTNGNIPVRLEPKGEGGVVDVIEDRSQGVSDTRTGGEFREWKNQSVDEVVNKVEVIAQKDGTVFRDTVSDSNSIDKYGEKFRRVKLQYANSIQEVNQIANNLLVPEPSSGGTVVTPLYVSDVLNDSFELYSDANELNGEVFTAVKVRHYFHESRTELVFEFETGNEELADTQVQTQYERDSIAEASSTNVGQQDSGTLSADNHDHDDGTLSADNHDHDDGTLSADNHDHTDGTLVTDDHDHTIDGVTTNTTAVFPPTSDDAFDSSTGNSVDDTGWTQLASVTSPSDPRSSHIDIVVTDNNQEMAIRLKFLDSTFAHADGSSDSVGWQTFLNTGDVQAPQIKFYPQIGGAGNETVVLEAITRNGTNTVDGYLAVRSATSHEHDITGETTGITGPNVSNNTGSTQPGVSNNTGSTQPGVSNNTGSTEPGVNNQTADKFVDVTTTTKTDR